MLVFSVESNFKNFGRFQGSLDIFGRIFAPFDDVHLLSVQFFNDCLDAFSAWANASSDRIDSFLIGENGNFGTIACFTRNRLDFNGSVKNFRNFIFKHALQQIRVRTTYVNLRSSVATLLFAFFFILFGILIFVWINNLVHVNFDAIV